MVVFYFSLSNSRSLLELSKKRNHAIEVTKKWLEARRSYLEKIKKQVELYLGYEEEAITNYEKSGLDLYSKIWDKASVTSFVSACRRASYILAGDFHSSTAIKRFYVRFFEENKAMFKGKKAVWALECFLKEDNLWLQKWIANEITDETLLEHVSWKESWGFHWKAYKEMIFALLDLGFDVQSINSPEEKFADRDREIARTLSVLKKDYDLVFCMIGQHHIAPQNLPEKIRDLEPKAKVLSWHLDPEDIYFSLAELNVLDEVSVLSHENHYCFLTTPPWVHWQSYILHLEEILDEDSYDVEDEDFAEIRGEDYESAFASYLDLLKNDLEIPLDHFPRVGISFIDDYVVHGESPKDLIEFMKPLMDAEISFYWPEQREGILVRNSLNQVASVAGKFLHLKIMGMEKLPWGRADTFEVWCWLEAVGYFLSKFINPKRSTKGAEASSAFLKARLGSKSGAAVLKALISTQVHDLDEGIEKRYFKDLSWEEMIYASRLKGALVGEGLFRLYSSGDLGVERLKSYLSVKIDAGERFEHFFKMVLTKIEEQAFKEKR